MTAQEVVAEITRRAWSFGVPVLLSPESSVLHSDGAPCSGYFDTDPLMLTVSTGVEQSDWLGILLHEYSHLTQWAEKCAIWTAHDKTPGMWDWLDGKPLRNARKVVELTRELEADCERRTVRLIQELRAPLDLKTYCQQANAYIHFHNVIADKRRWVKAAGVLRKPEVYQHFNTTMDADFSKTPKRLFDVLVEHGI